MDELYPGDPNYPALLGAIPSPPPRYWRGPVTVDVALALGIAGARDATPYGVEVAERLAGELGARGVTIVSGLARGIDAAAHRGALDAGGRTLAVLGCGIDVVYPPENRALARTIEAQGALVSQFARGAPALAGHFPARNRTLAGLSLGVVVVEAAERSGPLITAGCGPAAYGTAMGLGRRTRKENVVAKRSLVVVESPTKVKTIQKYLDSSFVVKASMGHVRDLPKSQLGVDPKKGFKPKYVVSPGKKKVLDELKKAAANADPLYVATDPDREGEAIGWHLAQELDVDKKNVYRISFNEITERAVKAAFAKPGRIDLRKVDAQQARRVLDRLVGYSLSPLLWDKVQRGLSAGRVQSVAVRLIVDREGEIQAFVPVEYWSLHARLAAKLPPEFVATLKEVDGEKVSLADGDATRALMAALQDARFIVKSVTRGERRRNPVPPFITSTLQQEAARKLGFTAKKTMAVAQQLYEGIDLGAEGAKGLITYMRTDSVRVAREAQAEAREWITARLGLDYVPDAPPAYRSRGSAQEAHEAIRPSEVRLEPRSVAQFLTRDQLALYRLVWERFLASQMMPAVYDTVTADIEAGRCLFRALGATLRFKGFTAVYEESREDEPRPVEDDPESAVPQLEKGEVLRLLALDPRQHFTQPPPHYTEASLIKTLE